MTISTTDATTDDLDQAPPPDDDSMDITAVDDAADDSTGRAPRWQRITATVLSATVVGGAVAAGWLWHDAAERDHVDAANAEAVDTAKQVVTDLTTLSHDRLTTTVNSVLAHTTGAFRNQFADSSDAFKAALTDGKVDSTGRIDSAGLIRGDGNTAEVLVAASSTVKNSQAPNGDPRVYRMKVTLQHAADKWLVSNVEFVA